MTFIDMKLDQTPANSNYYHRIPKHPSKSNVDDRLVHTVQTVYTRIMLSIRQLNRSRSQGGRGEYYVDTNDFDRLVTLFAAAKGKGEVRLLLRSLLTNREMADVVRRVGLARMIQQGMTYDQITDITQAGRSTIALVNNALKVNSGIFDKVLHRIPPDRLERAILNRLKRGK